MQDANIEEKVDVIISEWMGYMLLYEVGPYLSDFKRKEFTYFMNPQFSSPSPSSRWKSV